jgi:hypothetical protein
VRFGRRFGFWLRIHSGTMELVVQVTGQSPRGGGHELARVPHGGAVPLALTAVIDRGSLRTRHALIGLTVSVISVVQ